MMMENPKTRHQFWVMTQSTTYRSEYTRLLCDDLDIGVSNSDQILTEIILQHRSRGDQVPYRNDILHDKLVNIPRIRLPTSYYPDFLESKNCLLVSPGLFSLLDQPRGTLQGIETEITWVGPNPPDRTYLWLSHIPRVPTFGIERSDTERDEYPNPDDGAPPVQLGYSHGMVPRDAITSPYGVFRAAESGTVVLATDAVAEAVMLAGCTGIEFEDLETRYVNCGALYRRGPFEVELRPECVECRRANNIPVPEPEPSPYDDDC